jgi:SAM-dependent methyltransferase
MTRALSFGQAADAYERYRPTYPAALTADVAALVPGRRVLEVGAGTGKATRALLAAGLDVHCVEPDAAMAAHLPPGTPVEIARFEAWSGAGGPFDGLVSAQAWHWTDPATRWRDAAAALRPGGVIALFWNNSQVGVPFPLADLRAVYADHGLAGAGVDGLDSDQDAVDILRDVAEWPGDEMLADPGFADVAVRTYRWTMPSDAESYVAYMDTTSAHLVLPPDIRAALSRDLVAAIRAHCDAGFDVAMNAGLWTARRL